MRSLFYSYHPQYHYYYPDPGQLSKMIWMIFNAPGIKGSKYHVIEPTCHQPDLYQVTRSIPVGRVEVSSLNGNYCFVVVMNRFGKKEHRIGVNKEGMSAHVQLLDYPNMPVLYAGTVTFSDNKLLEWNNRTGLFKTSAEHCHQANFDNSKFKAHLACDRY